MTGNLIPSQVPGDHALAPGMPQYPQAYPQAWQSWAPAEEESGVSWSRYLAAIRRYKWLVLLLVLVGTAAGFAATRFIAPEYEVRAKVWIAGESNLQRDRGPIRAEELLPASSWGELLTASAILERVAREHGLYFSPADPADSLAFAGFDVGRAVRAGGYKLRIDDSGTQYTLATADGTPIEAGVVGDSIGRKVGFRWAPRPQVLGRGRTIEFRVIAPGDAIRSLASSLEATTPENGSFISVTMTGTDPHRTAALMNTLLDEFVATAAELKRRSLVEIESTLEDQLDSAARSLREAEIALERFRVNTITLPSEGTPVAGGVQLTQDPVMSNFFQQKIAADDLRREREALERILAQARAGQVSVDAFVPIGAAQRSPDLKAALDELSKKEGELRAAQQLYTDEHKLVRDLQRQVQALKTQAVPTLLRNLVEQLRAREQELSARVRSTERELQQIPTRSIEEMRRRREVETKQNLYVALKNRYEEAKMARASAVPDVSVLDSAVAPLQPTKNTAPRIVLMALLASIGGALGVALLLDHADPRFRYPDQVTKELGLSILGAVPTIHRSKAGVTNLDDATQVIEAFRTIRLNLRQAPDGGGPITLTITSPGPGDGKSLVSSNLALSFAEAGYRTLLIDGDIRRGELHAMFGVNRRPGLIDCLVGDVSLEDVLRVTTHDNLTLIPCGTRRHRGPELLVSQALAELIAELKRRYDVIIIDSPPLGAGIDPFVLGTATGNMVLVLRTGASDRKLVQNKMQTLRRLPIRLLGAVLNDIRATGEYRYYSYSYGYTTSEDEEVPQIPSRVGELSGRT